MAMSSAALEASGLTKRYRMGGGEVGRCEASTSTVRRASSSSCSGHRAAASRRCSTSSAASTSPTSGTVRFGDHD